MVKQSISQYGQTVTSINTPKNAYGIHTYVLRDRKGNHVGTICLTSSGGVTLASADGYKFTDAPIDTE